jgi:hypothetical protein
VPYGPKWDQEEQKEKMKKKKTVIKRKAPSQNTELLLAAVWEK